jgi:hypothetical protein
MKRYEHLGNGIEVTFCPAIPAKPHRYGTVAHYEYYARKSKKYYGRITYQDLCEWTRSVCEEVRTAFETHYNNAEKSNTNWGIMIHPESQKVIHSIKQKGYVEKSKVTMVFKARTDDSYPMSKFSHLIKTYFYVDEIPICNTSINNGQVSLIVPKGKYGEFAGSYAQDIEGLDDDTINDAFEGDPDNYWNID